MTNLSQTQIDEYLAFAHGLADAAGTISLKHFRTAIAVENKHTHLFDPVTQADKDAEAAMRVLIEASYPSHGILGEEHGRADSKDGLTWVIDPIDGTRAFITGNPLWGTLIALSDETGPLIGVCDQPFIGERFWGVRSEGRAGAFYRRGEEVKALKTRRCARLSEAALSTTTTEVFTTPEELAAFNALSRQARLTRFGGDCYGYGLLAYGFIDLIVEATLKAFDIHALIPIIEGAGGVVTTWSGGSPNDGGRIIAAGDPRTHAAALRVLQDSLR
jgi:histidinol-phosphatase